MLEKIDQLFEEKRKIELSRMSGNSHSLIKLREVATYLNKHFPNDFSFKVDGTDTELFDSVLNFEKKYRP